MATAAQPAASWHPQPQEYQGSVFPEVEEFLVMLYGFAFLFEDLARHVETLSVYQRKRISYILTLLTHP